MGTRAEAPPVVLVLVLVPLALAIASVGVGVGVTRSCRVGISTDRSDLLGHLCIRGGHDTGLGGQESVRDGHALVAHGGSGLVGGNGGCEVLLVLLDLRGDRREGGGDFDVGGVVVAWQRRYVCLLDGDAAAEVLGVAAPDGTDVASGCWEEYVR